MHRSLNHSPHNGSNPKTASTRSDSKKKPRPFREKHQANPYLTQTPTPREGGVMRLPVKNTPNQKRNLKTAPLRSDLAQKRAPKQRIPAQLHRGEGGVMRLSLKKPPPHERNPKTAPIRSELCQKEYLCNTKTAISGSNYNAPETLMTGNQS